MTSLYTYRLEKYSSTEILDLIATREFSLIRKEGNRGNTEISGEQKITGPQESEQAEQELFEACSKMEAPVKESPEWTADLVSANTQLQIEIEERKRAEAAFCESTEKYKTLFKSIDDGFFLIDIIFDENNQPVDMYYVEGNNSATKILGRDYTGKRLREIDPNCEPYWYEIFGKVALTGESIRMEQYAAPDRKWYNFYVFKLGGRESRRIGTIFEDITERKRREGNAAILAEISNDFSRLSTSREIMQTVGAKISKYLNISNCLFAEIDETEDKVIAEYAWGNGDIPEVTGTHRLSKFVDEEFRQAACAGEPIVIRDTQTDPRTDAKSYAAFNIHSFVTVPFHKDGKWKYLFTINDSSVRDWREDEIELILEVTSRMFPKLERACAEEALLQSETRYKMLFDSIDEGFCIIEVIFDEKEKSVDYCFLQTNPSFEKQTGLLNVVGKRIRELVPEHEEHWFEIYGQIALTGQSVRFQNSARELNRWYDVYAFRYDQPEKHQVAILFNDITKSKQTEEALIEKDAQLSAFLEQLPVGIGLFDAQGCWLIKNKIFQRFVTDVIPSQDLENSWRWKAWGPDGHLLEKSQWPGARALRGEKVDGLDMLYRTDTGLEIWTRVSSVPFRDKAGQIKGVISVIQDIDKQKRIEEALSESREQYQTLFNSISEGFAYYKAIYDEKGALHDMLVLEINPAGARLSGIAREAQIGKNWRELWPEVEDYWFETYKKVDQIGRSMQYENFSKITGKWYSVQVDRVQKGQFVTTFRDITERKQEEHRIHRYNNVLEGINHIFAKVVQTGTEEELGKACLSVALAVTDSVLGFIGEVGTDGFVRDIAISDTGWNQCQMYDKTGHHQYPENLILKGLYGRVINSGKSFFTNDPAANPFSNGVPEGHPPLESFLGAPLNLDGETKGVIVVANRKEGYTAEQQEDLEAIAPAIMQVLQRKKAEVEREKVQLTLSKAYQDLEEKVKTRTYELEKAYNSLKDNERRLSEAQRMAHIGYWDWDISNDRLYWSEEMYRIFGLSPQGFGATYAAFLNSIHPNDRDFVDKAVKKALTGAQYAVDFRIITPAEREENIVFAQGKVFFNNKNAPVLMRGTVQDITEKRQAEKAFLNSVATRKKEIHHRIKNNLQVISSLLDLQAEKFGDKECLNNSEVFEAFKESQDRVASIALIHEELHEGGGNDTLNFSDYLKKLTEHLFKTYRYGNADISLNMDVEEDIFFDMDTAVPLGIIVNELVSNSLKYAFPDRDKGEIQIRLYREEAEDCEENRVKRINEEFKNPAKDMKYKLEVSDNGIGVPEHINLEDSESLGIQLVTILVDQLDGEIELKREEGTEFIIKIPVTEKY